MTSASRSSLFALVLALACALLPAAASAAQYTVTIGDNYYTSQTINVNIGDTVTWTNQGSQVHTVTSDTGTFNSGPIQPGQQFQATFNQAGNFPYHDNTYGASGGSGMWGSVTVASVAPGTEVTPSYANPNATYYGNAAPTTAVSTTDASSLAALEAQVQSLLAEINTLQGSGAASTPATIASATGAANYNSSSCPLIGGSLQLGSSGADVSRLQQFLALDPTVYPEGIVSGYYGTLTQSAVQRWQTKYNIVSSGTPASSGFGVVGPRTAAAIALLCTTGSYGGVSGPSSPVGGFISVTPVSGNAPLAVSVTATVNTTSSCSGAQYILDFGDNSGQQQVPVSSGDCQEVVQTFQHTYTYGGTYQITLSAGSHQTTAAVTVTGPAAPATGASAQVPTGNISAFVQSGNAPLNVTFYVSCVAGVAYNVVFGDGSDLGSSVSQSTCNGSLQSISHTYTQAGSFEAQLVLFVQHSNGIIAPLSVGDVGITVSNPASNYSYNPPQLSPSSDPDTFSIEFDLPSSCTGYNLNWGDATGNTVQPDNSTSCAYAPTTVTLTHTYSADGNYTITLERGPGLTDTRTIAVTVST